MSATNERMIIDTDRKTIAEGVLRMRGKPFSLASYIPFHAIYQVVAKKMVIISGRQVSKSTSIAAFGVSEAIGEAFWQSLTVHPSLTQSRNYSNQRVAGFIKDSPDIARWFVDTHCRKNTAVRSFTNDSVMYFGATSQMESLRGLSANRVFEDEIQDMVGDDLAVIEEVMSGQSSDKKFVMRTGTAKTVGNILEDTWRKSTMAEWIVPCPSGHWNIPSVENIGEKGFICKKCKSLCNVRLGKWYSPFKVMDEREWVGFRVPQIILPLHTEDPGNWKDLLIKMHGGIDANKFLNEVMGQSAGSGITILSEDDLRACCDDYRMYDNLLIPDADQYYYVFATVDWGLTARKSYTIISIWGITADMRQKLLYSKRYLEPDVIKQVHDIAYVCKSFAVDAIGVDWGAGVAQSRLLEQEMGQAVQRFMYVSEQHKMMNWDPRSQVWKVNRTQAMLETFVKMRRKQYQFPVWEQYKNFADDVLCIYEEPLDDRNGNDKIKFDHPDGAPDDWTHTAVYCNLLLHIAQNQGKGT